MGKKNVKNTLQIHSQAKIEFYEKYLNRYLRILCLSKFIKRINIYDVFCGMGIYEDGGKGSPIVAFEARKKSFYVSWSNYKDNKVKFILEK
jgi:three-Cys-motif partner protein